jgi:hypothetical protein
VKRFGENRQTSQRTPMHILHRDAPCWCGEASLRDGVDSLANAGFSNRKTDFSCKEIAFSSKKTPIPYWKTDFSSKKTTLPNKETGFSCKETANSSWKTPFSCLETAFSSKEIPSSNKKTGFSSKEISFPCKETAFSTGKICFPCRKNAGSDESSLLPAGLIPQVYRHKDCALPPAILSSMIARSHAPASRSHAGCPKPGFRSTVFR